MAETDTCSASIPQESITSQPTQSGQSNTQHHVCPWSLRNWHGPSGTHAWVPYLIRCSSIQKHYWNFPLAPLPRRQDLLPPPFLWRFQIFRPFPGLDPTVNRMLIHFSLRSPPHFLEMCRYIPLIFSHWSLYLSLWSSFFLQYIYSCHCHLYYCLCHQLQQCNHYYHHYHHHCHHYHHRPSPPPPPPTPPPPPPPPHHHHHNHHLHQYHHHHLSTSAITSTNSGFVT